MPKTTARPNPRTVMPFHTASDENTSEFRCEMGIGLSSYFLREKEKKHFKHL